MLSYEFRDQDLLGFQLLIYRINYTNNIIPKNVGLNTFGEHKELINVYKTNLGFSSLPLTSSSDKYGKPLSKFIENDIVKSVTLTDGVEVNIVDKINSYLPDKNKVSSFSAKTNFYQLPHINNIVIVEDGVSGESNIGVYDSNGMKIQHLVEKSLDENNFYRKVGNVNVYINNNQGVYKKTIKLFFNSVYPNKLSGYFSKLIFTDNRIGTFDIETYYNSYGKSKTYALGFYTNDTIKTFYIDENLDSDSLIMKCLDSMLIEKYSGFTFYVHNLGRFDIYFILRIIINANINFPDVYSYNIIPRDKTIIYIILSKKVGKKNIK